MGRPKPLPFIKTSDCLLMLFLNEGQIEAKQILSYTKQLIDYGFLTRDGTKISLTEKGKEKAEQKKRQISHKFS